MNNYLVRVGKFLQSFGRNFWNVGKEDPRRVIHALKLGASMTLVSQLHFVEPIAYGIGKHAIWAVMTVAVVLEFTVGATVRKGISRGIGTLFAGLLALLMDFIANRCTHALRPVFIGCIIFVIGAATTYIRFLPDIKNSCDYGVSVFLVAFNLFCMSSYGVENILHLAQQKFYTISISVGICLFMSIFVFPNWSGQQLHDNTLTKIEGLASSLEACVSQYFSDSTSDSAEDALSDYSIHLAVLDSAVLDKTLAMYASWEPRYSRKSFKFPWQHYVKVGGSLRHFGCSVVALHGCLHTEIQTPKDVCALFKEPCISLATEVSKALRELSNSIRHKRHCSSSLLLDHVQKAVQELQRVLKSQPRLFLHPSTSNTHLPQNLGGIDTNALFELKSKETLSGRMMLRTLSKIALHSLEFAEALPFAAFASLLLETVVRLDLVIEEVEELGRVDNYRKEFKPVDEVVVNCDNTTLPNTGLHNHDSSV